MLNLGSRGSEKSRTLTEVGIVEEVLVEENHTGTQRDPDTIIRRVLVHEAHSVQLRGCSGSPHVDRGVECGLGSLRLLSGRVDRGEGLLAHDLTGGADLLAVRAHIERSSSLIGEELA